MNPRINDLMYYAGLTAQGCWDDMDDYDQKAILKFSELIVRECSGILRKEATSNWEGREERLLNAMANWIEEHFGVEK